MCVCVRVCSCEKQSLNFWHCNLIINAGYISKRKNGASSSGDTCFSDDRNVFKPETALSDKDRPTVSTKPPGSSLAVMDMPVLYRTATTSGRMCTLNREISRFKNIAHECYKKLQNFS